MSPCRISQGSGKDTDNIDSFPSARIKNAVFSSKTQTDWSCQFQKVISDYVREDNCKLCPTGFGATEMCFCFWIGIARRKTYKVFCASMRLPNGVSRLERGDEATH